MNPQDMGQGMGGGMPQPDPNAQPAQDPNAGQDIAPFDVYEKLRSTILELLKQGLPGSDQLLLAIDKIQAKNIQEATAQGAGGQAGVNSPQAGGQYGQAQQSPQ
jgi:hypothetical protein